MKPRFSQNASTYDQEARVQKLAATSLLEKVFQKMSAINKVCDLGSGTGMIPQILLQAYPNVEIDCCDISQEMLNILKGKLPQGNISAKLSSLPPNEDYELITSNFSLQWFPSIKDTLSRSIERLKESGLLAISLPISGTFDHLQNSINETGVQINLPPLPSKELIINCFNEEKINHIEVIDLYDYFPDTLEFLKGLHKIGATREGSHTSRKDLRKLIEHHDNFFKGPVAAKYKVLQLIYKR